MKLRDYQQECSDTAINHLKKSIAPILIEAATGAGKSLIVAAIAKWISDIAPSKKILCLAPSKELVEQNYEKYLMTGSVASIFCASAGSKCLNHAVVFCSPLTTANSIDEIAQMPVAAIIIDECFSGETLISTPFGNKKIHSVRSGDIVYNAIGIGVVQAVSVKEHHEIHIVRLSNGQEIRTTSNHPFFTTDGWVNAKKLAGKSLIRLQDMPLLWDKDDTEQAKQIKKMFRERKAIQRKKMLLKLLCKEIEQPNMERLCFRKNEGNFKTHWSQTDTSWWKWKTANRATKKDVGNTWSRLENGITNKNKCRSSKRSLSELLQGRYWERITKDSCRARWKNTQWTKEIIRRKKRQIPKIIRVESVSVEKSRSTTPMYNLQVSGHPSYFAGGVLVHNCHGLTQTVLNIIETVKSFNPNVRIIGLTATPYRMNTGYIYSVDEWGDTVHETKAKNPFFEKLVYRVTAPYLIERGFLTPPKLIDISKSYDTKTLKLNKLNRFDDDELERIFSDKTVTQVIIDLIIEQTQSSKGVLIFATTIKHAQDILNLLPVGDCRLVTGSTQKKEREEIIAMFKAKMFKYLVNVAVLTTGFDAPHVDFVAVLRPTESRGLFQQIIGRGTRLHDDKEFFVVCDCAGNIERHGLQDDLFNPEIANVKEDSDATFEDVDCPVCGFANQNKWIEVKGKMISTLRRCKAVYPIEGIENPVLKKHFYRCSHYFKFKECPECGSENDITARVCKKCRYQIIKPDEKLKLGSKSTTFQHDIESFEILPHHSHAGNDGFKAIINGKYTKYFATHTKRGLAEYEKCAELQPKQIIISTGGKYPEIKLIW